MPITSRNASDGRATRWDSHRVSRRAELVRAARRAVHRRGPDLSMDELAAEIGTSKSILYRYFTDKTGLQEAVGHAVLAWLRTALEEAGRSAREPRDRLAAMVEAYLEMVEASPHVYAFVTHADAGTAGALRGFVADIEQVVAEALLPVLRLRAPGEATSTGRDAESRALAALWSAGMVGLVRGAAERWRAEADDGGTGGTIAAMDRARLAEHLTAWLWEGAAGVPRRTPTPATTRPETP
ncbi:TetR family transcriptional regulator [Georgenia faecalis]|uniref:TetR family transcriptional regulator n=1 Tax=Georgenia faecalis TaxID=2483799 RepID=A0ABV9DDG9_9MICO|nr:TetR family transcriptional regulator [Georgenia faecalis]